MTDEKTRFTRSEVRKALEAGTRVGGGIIYRDGMIDLGDDKENPAYAAERREIIERTLDDLEQYGLIENDEAKPRDCKKSK